MYGCILTNSQVAKAIYVEEDYDPEVLEGYAKSASSFLYHKTGYDFSKDYPIEPLAIECAKQYVRMLHFGANGYSKEHDYTLGINSMLVDLQNIANARLQASN